VDFEARREDRPGHAIGCPTG